MTRIRTLVVAVVLAASTYGIVRGSAPAQTGTWTSAGTIADSREGAAAVPLADGRTLITGGTVAGGAATDTVVIYDPIANSFSAAGQLIAARVGHTATLLADGRVLVAGGTIGSQISADVELFDPTSGTSSLVAVMWQPRTAHAAARLADGAVLIVGGSTTNGVVLQSAEIFNPASGTDRAAFISSPAATRRCDRYDAHRRPRARGWWQRWKCRSRSAEEYHPTSQTFALVPTQLSVPRRGHTAVLLPHNNGVLIAGGTAAAQAVSASDLFLPAIFPDPFSFGVGEFVATGSMITSRTRAIGGPAGEGYAFAAGGGSGDFETYRFATIKTDKDDYAPGERAVITGSGWQPNEEVTLLFQEDPAVHEDYTFPVTADATGNIHWDQWAPEEHDLNVRFYLTAHDSRSRAQTTFTDAVNSASITIRQFVSSPPLVCGAVQSTFTQGATVCANVQVTFNGNSPFRVQWYAPGAVISTSTPVRDTSFSSQPASPATVTDSFATTTTTPTGLWTVVVCTGSQAGPCPPGNQRGPTTFTLNAAANTPPVINSNNATVSVNEGQTAANAGTWSDVNAGDTVTLSASVGTVIKAGTNASGTWSWSFATTDGPVQSQTVTITANDGNGGETTTTFDLTVNNVAPTATFGATSPINEGSNSTLSLTSPSDPSTADTTAGFKYHSPATDWTRRCRRPTLQRVRRPRSPACSTTTAASQSRAGSSTRTMGSRPIRPRSSSTTSRRLRRSRRQVRSTKAATARCP